MSIFREYITNRRAEIKCQIAALRAEMRDLDTAENALEIETGNSGQRAEAGQLTIKDMVLGVLSDRGEQGADALHIIRLITQKYSKEIQRPSLSPQLTRLKRSGLISLEGNIWFITENGKRDNKKRKTPHEETSQGANHSGGGLVRGTPPKQAPEGSIPSTSTQIHHQSVEDWDDEVPF
jgi:hypothetical protein